MPETLSNDAWSARLTELLEQQQQIVRRLTDLAARQTELIEDGRAEALLGLLGRRQTLIDEFIGTQAPLVELTDELDERLATLAVDQRRRIRGLVETIGRGLAGVMDTDARDEQTLRTRRDARRDDLAAHDAGRSARAAYLGTSPGTSRYADRRG
ncbi:MAG: flagellar export chaperone FlgN [Planctomycetota bacterium]|jgi:hypothetical protein